MSTSTLDAPQPTLPPPSPQLQPTRKQLLDRHDSASSTPKGRSKRPKYYQIQPRQRSHKGSLINEVGNRASQVGTLKAAPGRTDPPVYGTIEQQHPTSREIKVLANHEQGSGKLKRIACAPEEHANAAEDNDTAMYRMMDDKDAIGAAIGDSENKSSRFKSRNADSRCTLPSKEQLRRDAIIAARRIFEAEQKRVLSLIPQSIRDTYGQMGFVKWNRCMRPVLVVNPYHAPPAPVRKDYFVRI
jgi:hypothetical protein